MSEPITRAEAKLIWEALDLLAQTVLPSHIATAWARLEWERLVKTKRELVGDE